MTRLAVPIAGHQGLDDPVGEHFGRVPAYVVVDTSTGRADVIPNTSEHAGGTGLPAEILATLGIDVLLCRGLGRRAIGLLASEGIDVRIGATGSAREAIAAWKEGQLLRASEDVACNEHAFHDRDEKRP
ncbi:MAG: NifB/NifX family molybdenum-iron cluster-binding protein [Candidatus Bipolaricaulota bacterium]